MQPRFYTTTVESEQSLGEIQTLLRKYGARRFGTEWDDEGVASVHFNLPVPEADGMINVVLRPRVAVVEEKMSRTPTGRLRRYGIDKSQVERVAWRQMKAILEGMLLAVDTGMFSAGQVFMGMAETDDGEPLWDIVVAHGIAGLLAPAVEAELIE